MSMAPGLSRYEFQICLADLQVILKLWPTFAPAASTHLHTERLNNPCAVDDRAPREPNRFDKVVKRIEQEFPDQQPKYMVELVVSYRSA
jgi:hypothetical protein